MKRAGRMQPSSSGLLHASRRAAAQSCAAPLVAGAVHERTSSRLVGWRRRPRRRGIRLSSRWHITARRTAVRGHGPGLTRCPPPASSPPCSTRQPISAAGRRLPGLPPVARWPTAHAMRAKDGCKSPAHRLALARPTTSPGPSGPKARTDAPSRRRSPCCRLAVQPEPISAAPKHGPRSRRYVGGDAGNIVALMTNRNSPSVSSVTGSVSNTSSGRSSVLSRPITNAAIIASPETGQHDAPDEVRDEQQGGEQQQPQQTRTVSCAKHSADDLSDAEAATKARSGGRDCTFLHENSFSSRCARSTIRCAGQARNRGLMRFTASGTSTTHLMEKPTMATARRKRGQEGTGKDGPRQEGREEGPTQEGGAGRSRSQKGAGQEGAPAKKRTRTPPS